MTVLSNIHLSYCDAGVDIDAAQALVETIKPLSQSTFRKGVLGNIGGFSALFEICKKIQEPILVSSTDGVGTKLKLAAELGYYNTIGIDLVAMCVNDIIVQGAEPLFFLDYFSYSNLETQHIINVINSIAQGCKIANCALIGGETAEMPNMYLKGEYDLAGFVVGVVEKNKLINGVNITSGDVVLGLTSSGIHSNGYSLVRKIINLIQPNLNLDFYDKKLADVLLAPTRIYVKSILTIMNQVDIHGLVHVTGGGLIKNIPRVLKSNLTAILYRDTWIMPPVFKWLQQHGGITDTEMYRVFNCGIGMVIIVSAHNADQAILNLQNIGEKVIRIGNIRERFNNEAQTIII